LRDGLRDDMATVISVSKLIFGIREPLKLSGFPDGRIRLRMRSCEFARARVKTKDGIVEFYVSEKDGCWVPCIERGRNFTV
jgi:hypothetical protein